MENNTTRVNTLQFEYGISRQVCASRSPRISWKVEAGSVNWIQSAYEIECHNDQGRLIQSSGVISAPESNLVPWPFAPLKPRQRMLVRVRVWGEQTDVSPWSDAVQLEYGLGGDDWTADFIGRSWHEPIDGDHPPAYFRKGFSLPGSVASARLYITSLGLYQAYINGQAVGDEVMAPGWSVYDDRLLYQVYYVGPLLQSGENALGVIVADGWFRGRLGFGEGRRNIYGDTTGVVAQLELTLSDGASVTIISDESWSSSNASILASSIYDGEVYDARLEAAGWSLPGFDDSAWEAVRILSWNKATLVPSDTPPIKRTATFKAQRIFKSPRGRQIIDFGQNIVGRVRIHIDAPEGHEVSLLHAEALDGGELALRPLRTAKANDRYISAGTGPEVWEPLFTFHGFRYVQVDNWPGELAEGDIEAVVLGSEMARTGNFSCSHQLLNRLHENVVWGMRGNFLAIPSDCPQRDERLGWTGDIQIFSPTASYLYDVRAFLGSWLADLSIEQERLGGSVPHVVPNALGDGDGAAAWGDAAVIVPWVLYQHYGDTGILERQYSGMRAWVEFVANQADPGYLWDQGFQFGDWLDPSAPPDKPWESRTDTAIVATAYFFKSAGILAKAAGLLGKPSDAAKYSSLAEQIKSAFQREYITAAGRLMSDSQSAYALAIVFELFDDVQQKQQAGERLSQCVMSSGYRIGTGFVGTPLICDALCQTGHLDDAYRLLLQTENPSWLYPVTMGATTIWERWDSLLPDGSVNPGEMTSFNHYALGAIADWMHRTIGGIGHTSAGYRQIIIAPQPGDGITSCTTSLESPYGRIGVHWEIRTGRFALEVDIPPNSQAAIQFPPGAGGEEVIRGSGHWSWDLAYTAGEPEVLTVDDSIARLFYDDALRGALMGQIHRLNPPEYFFGLLFSDQSKPLRSALQVLPDAPEAIATIEDQLGQLQER